MVKTCLVSRNMAVLFCSKTLSWKYPFYLIRSLVPIQLWPVVYEVKCVLFNSVFCYVKLLPRSCLPDMFLPLIRPFKWGTAQGFASGGIRITTSQIQKYQKRPTSLSKLGSPKVWLLVFLIPLEIEFHAVPHLKGLINGKNISDRQQHVGISM